MKSAYEIAMARLEKESGPARKLTDEQRAKIAEINAAFDAKMAELRLAFDADIAKATTADEARQLQARLTQELTALDERREYEKEAVWKQTTE